MSVYLLKLFSWVLYPLSWVILLLCASWLLRYLRYVRVSFALFALGFVLLWVVAMPVTGQYLIRQLEQQFPMQDIKAFETADAIVLLGGGMGGDAPPMRLQPDLGDAADRVWYAAQLYHAGKAPFIIASGGLISWKGDTQTEAAAMRLLLTQLAVPEQAIVDEANSLSTYENAIYTRNILEQYHVQRVLLVTSAAHMPRAMAVFKGQMPTVTFVAATTDVRGLPLDGGLLDYLPTAAGMAKTTETWHEMVGYMMYAIKGWI